MATMTVFDCTPNSLLGQALTTLGMDSKDELAARAASLLRVHAGSAADPQAVMILHAGLVVMFASRADGMAENGPAVAAALARLIAYIRPMTVADQIRLGRQLLKPIRELEQCRLTKRIAA